MRRGEEARRSEPDLQRLAVKLETVVPELRAIGLHLARLDSLQPDDRTVTLDDNDALRHALTGTEEVG